MLKFFKQGCARFSGKNCLLDHFKINKKGAAHSAQRTAHISFDQSISICARELPGQQLTVVQTEAKGRLPGSLSTLERCEKSLADSLSTFSSK